ncbi:hypothetical protein [Streptomyces hirsutus]|uniref:hypothetical protein n=1 Tax=Streptomyces hirsutus TaxID=35620 RepID=UPI000B026712|nr:hypothetical protein [Streptomyces hirsutus]
MSAWDALCMFLRTRTVEADYRVFLTSFMQVFTAWCGDRAYGPFHAADVAPLIEQAGYRIEIAKNGSLVISGLRIPARR